MKYKQFKSNAYHLESQGALERFHQTLENMMKTFCLDSHKDWDDGVSILLFATKEAFPKSLRFIPFELFFWTLCRKSLLKENGFVFYVLAYKSI